jgi:hypothetical protein
MTDRHISSSFWTHNKDALLQKLGAAGLPADEIARRLEVSANVVRRRSQHLQNLVSRQDKIRASTLKIRANGVAAALAAMHEAAPRGIPGSAGIARAIRAGAGRARIAHELDVTHQAIDRIALRFWRKVTIRRPEQCWAWRAAEAHGYGTFWVAKDRSIQAHRMAWILTHGWLSHSRLVRHRCRANACCNPRHLFLGWRGDNAPRRKARTSKRLTPPQVKAILADRRSSRVLAPTYKVTDSAIRMARLRANRKHKSRRT